MALNSLCGNCKFWCPPPPQQNPQGMVIGQCRRYAPTVFMTLTQAPGSGKILQGPGGPQTAQMMPVFPSAWPQTPAEGWCGDHIFLDTGGAKE